MKAAVDDDAGDEMAYTASDAADDDTKTIAQVKPGAATADSPQIFPPTRLEGKPQLPSSAQTPPREG